MSGIEDRLRDTFHAAAALVDESPDLWARVERTIEEAGRRRRFRARLAIGIAGYATINGAIVALSSDIDEGTLHMRWWILELLTAALLVALALTLGPFIKRFGKSYAGDVFRANPRTGKSYIVLTDVAYYLIFLAYTLFTTTVELPRNWEADVNAAQLKTEIARVGGILLIIGVLHSINIVMLPMMGRLLTLNRHLEEGRPGPRPTAPDPSRGAGASPITSTGLPAGGWVLRIEPAPPSDDAT